MDRKKTRCARYREIIIRAYGSECECCKEKIERFLTIDHVENDGYKEPHSGLSLYSRIIKDEFPKSIRLLCFNCNLGRGLNGGICPHKSVIDI